MVKTHIKTDINRQIINKMLTFSNNDGNKELLSPVTPDVNIFKFLVLKIHENKNLINQTTDFV